MTTKKFTLASAKSFIKKNAETLLIKVSSDFNGMTDSVENNYKAEFVKAEKGSFDNGNNLGFRDIWFVLGSRDSLTAKYVNDVLVGFICYNCCGSWEVKIPS